HPGGFPLTGGGREGGSKNHLDAGGSVFGPESHPAKMTQLQSWSASRCRSNANPLPAHAETAKANVGATLVKHPEPRTFQFRSSPPKRGPRRRMIEWIPAYTGMSG